MAAPWEKYQSPEPQQGGIFTLPPNPREERKDRRAEAKDARDAENDRIRIQLDLQTAKLRQMEEERKAAEWAAKFNPDGSPKPNATDDSRGRLTRLNGLIGQINRVQELYDAGPGKTKGFSGIKDYLPSDANAAFDAAGASLSQQGLAAFRVPGTGTVSDRDAIMFDKANLPTADTRDAAIEEQLRGLRARVEEELKGAGAAPPKWKGVTPPAPPLGGAFNENALVSQQALGAADPNATDQTIPIPPAMQQEYDAFMGQWARNPDVGAYVAFRRQLDQKYNFPLDPSMDAKNQQWASEAAANLKAGGATVNTAIPGVEKPMSDAEILRNKAVNNPLGAGMVGFTNAVGMGGVEALAGGQMNALREARPYSTMAGEVGGVIGATGGIGKIGGAIASKYAPGLLSANSLVARGARTLAPDMIYGAGRGGVVDGDPGTGALAAGAGSLAGNALGKAAGGLLGGMKQSAASKYLQDQGIFQTVGQKTGGLLKSVEDRMMSVPWVGDAVGNLRRDSFQDFNQAAFRQAGEPIGANVNAVGENGLSSLQSQIGNAYDNATQGVRVPLDPQFPADLQAVAQQARGLPLDLGQRFAAAMDNRVQPIAQAGELTGETYQQAQRGLKGYKAEMTKPGFEQDYRDALSLTQKALRDQMERGGGQSVVEGLGNADAAYRNYKTLADAVTRARNGSRSGTIDQFAPSQLNDAVAATQRKFPGAHPLSGLGKAGQEVLPSQIPDSGTAGRLAQMATLGGVGGLGAGGGYATDTNPMTAALGSLAAITALRGGASKPAQALLSKLFVNPGNSPLRDMSASQIRKLGGLLGTASIPLLLQGNN